MPEWIENKKYSKKKFPGGVIDDEYIKQETTTEKKRVVPAIMRRKMFTDELPSFLFSQKEKKDNAKLLEDKIQKLSKKGK